MPGLAELPPKAGLPLLRPELDPPNPGLLLPAPKPGLLLPALPLLPPIAGLPPLLPPKFGLLTLGLATPKPGRLLPRVPELPPNEGLVFPAAELPPNGGLAFPPPELPPNEGLAFPAPELPPKAVNGGLLPPLFPALLFPALPNGGRPAPPGLWMELRPGRLKLFRGASGIELGPFERVAEVKPDGMTWTTSSLKGGLGAGGGAGVGSLKTGTKGLRVVVTKSTAALAALLKELKKVLAGRGGSGLEGLGVGAGREGVAGMLLGLAPGPLPNRAKGCLGL